MDTTLLVPASFIENIEELPVVELTQEERLMIEDYISLTRDIIESKQLFDVFYFNLSCLRNSFTLYSSDTVKQLPGCPKCDSENIALNTFVINILSSAKSLAEYLRATAARWLKKDESNNDKFNLYVSKIYDTSVIYRILMNMRDFVQHRGLPVSFREGRYSFDLQQIIDTPHFNLNKQAKNDMENFLSKFDLSKQSPCLALTITLADFVVMLIDIYNKYLHNFKSYIYSSYKKIKDIIKIKPSLLCKTNEAFKDHIIYEIDGMYHCFDTKANPNKMLSKYKKYSKELYEQEKKAFDDIKACFSFSPNEKMENNEEHYGNN